MMENMHYFLWVLAGVLAGFLLVGLWNSLVVKSMGMTSLTAAA